MSEKSKHPTHKLFAILPRGGEDTKDFWVEVGAAWTNSDGSLNIRQELTPRDANATLQLRAIEAKDEE